MKEMNSLIAHRNGIEKMWFQTLEFFSFLLQEQRNESSSYSAKYDVILLQEELR